VFEDNLTRRDFVAGLATAGAAATLTGAGEAFAASDQQAAYTSHPMTDFKAPTGPVRTLCTEKITPEEAAKFKNAGKNIDLVIANDAADSMAKIADAEVVLGRVSKEAILAAKKLKWVHTWEAGVENLPKELMAHPCVLTNMQRVFAPVIAESFFGLLLSLTRGLAQSAIPNFKQRLWKRDDTPLEDLYGKTLGIVGMGGIGAETARRAYYGFSMKVLATDAKPLPKPDYVAELREPEWVHEMAPQVDVLLSAAPLTDLTRKMFNEALFRKLKPTAYFINVSRGGLVDQEALVKALQEKWFRGAGLDVTTPEPLPAEHALWQCPNLVISPHNSGYAPIRQVRLIGIVAENLRRYSLGLPLANVVDKVRGY
jgi:phosphoglycerate dehydrogenase-like enzyme